MRPLPHDHARPEPLHVVTISITVNIIAIIRIAFIIIVIICIIANMFVIMIAIISIICYNMYTYCCYYSYYYWYYSFYCGIAKHFLRREAEVMAGRELVPCPHCWHDLRLY